MANNSKPPLRGNYGYGSGGGYGTYGSWGGYSGRGGGSWNGYSNFSAPSYTFNGVTAANFEKGTITAAKTLSGDKSIQVVFGGEEVKVTDDTITLPSIDPIHGISHSDARVVRGFTDHEIIKRRISRDNNSIIERLKKGKNGAHKLFESIENARIDKAGLTLYSGTKDNLEASLDKASRSIVDKLRAQPELADNLDIIGPIAIELEARKLMGYDISGHTEIMDSLQPLDRALIESLAEEVTHLPDGVLDFGEVDDKVALNGRDFSLELAKKANKLFALRAAEKAEEEKNNGNGKGSAAPGEGELGEDETGGGGADPSPGSEDLSLDMTSAINKILEKSIPYDGSVYLPGQRAMDVFLQPVDILAKAARSQRLDTDPIINAQKVARHGLDVTNAVLRETSSSLSVMKTQLERLLMSKALETREEKKGGGKLNTRKLVQAFNADDNVFTKRADDVAINTAVQVVVDLSGSMSGAKMYLAIQSAILIAEALSKCMVPFEIVGFRTVGGGVQPGKNCSTEQAKTIQDMQSKGKIHRFDRIEMSYFKPFDSRYQMCLPSIGNMQSGGSNADGESVLYASESLLKRPERKKVMMVLSDGQPAFGYNNTTDSAVRKHLKDTVKNIEKKGVHVIGIGIASDEVKSFYTNRIVVNNIKELPKEILKQLTMAIG